MSGRAFRAAIRVVPRSRCESSQKSKDLWVFLSAAAARAAENRPFPVPAPARAATEMHRS